MKVQNFVLHEPDGRIRAAFSGFLEDAIGTAKLNNLLLYVNESGVLADPSLTFLDLNLGGVQTKAALPAPTVSYPGALQVTLADLPRPCVVRIGATEYTVSDGSAEIVFSAPGEYRVIIQSLRYLDYETTVYPDAGRGVAAGTSTAAAVSA